MNHLSDLVIRIQTTEHCSLSTNIMKKLLHVFHIEKVSSLLILISFIETFVIITDADNTVKIFSIESC